MAAAASMASRLGFPPGFRFVPRDEEVVAYFLLRRIRGQPLPVGDILEDDPLSAPPWLLLQKHGQKRDAFFFAAGQAMNGKGSRQKRSCAGGGTWEGQGKRRCPKGGEGEKQLSVLVRGEKVEWQKYALNFHEDGVKGSTGWVMHEYSITSPPDLAASPMRVYRIRFSGHGRNAKKRKRDELGWGSDDEEEEEEEQEEESGEARAATRPRVAEAGALFADEGPSATQPEYVGSFPLVEVDGGASGALFAGEGPSATQPESIGSFPLVEVDGGDGNHAGLTEAGEGSALAAATSSDEELPAPVDDGGDDWSFMCSLADLVPGFDWFAGAADAGDASVSMVTAA